MKQPTSRAARSLRRRMKGNFFAFVAAQVLIAVVAFIVVNDYAADGPIKREVSNILTQVAGNGRDAKSNQDAVIVVTPPTGLNENSNNDTTAIREIPAPPKPVETPPVQIQKPVASVEPAPPAAVPSAVGPAPQAAVPSTVEPAPQATVPSTVEPAPQAAVPSAVGPAPQAAVPLAVEPAPQATVPPAVGPVPQAAVPSAVGPAPQAAVPSTVEPAPQAEEPPAAPLIQPQTAAKAGEDVVALAPIPDLTPLQDAPVAAPPVVSTKPKQADGQTIRDCATCPELVLINAGRFAMGAEPEGLEQQVNLTTTQEVEIAALFAIGRHEITFDEWSQCVGDGGCTSQPADENWGRGRRPVINVSFNDITQQYLPWLSRKTGFTYRLPTEAEWEFAARGGGAAPAGQAYSFGDDGSLLCQYGNSSDRAATGSSCSDGYATTAPAGSLKANALGLFDMHGNVWEWTADCWQPQYSAKPVKSAETCTTRVLRGGSWASAASALRSAARGWESQDKSKNSIGFRVARVQP